MDRFAIASAHRGDETKTEQTSFLRTRNTCRGTKGKKNRRRSLRHGLGSLLVPADIPRLEKNWSIDGRRPSAEKKKIERTLGPVSIVRLTFEGDIRNGSCVQENFTAGTGTSSCSMPTEQLDGIILQDPCRTMDQGYRNIY